MESQAPLSAARPNKSSILTQRKDLARDTHHVIKLCRALEGAPMCVCTGGVGVPGWGRGPPLRRQWTTYDSKKMLPFQPRGLKPIPQCARTFLDALVVVVGGVVGEDLAVDVVRVAQRHVPLAVVRHVEVVRPDRDLLRLVVLQKTEGYQ